LSILYFNLFSSTLACPVENGTCTSCLQSVNNIDVCGELQWRSTVVVFDGEVSVLA